MIDIYSKSEWPASELSNFPAHGFDIDGVKCASMEGFLQSLKFSDSVVQRLICAMIGGEAKRAGKNQDWKSTQTLYWLGRPYRRDSSEYQALLWRAYTLMMSQSAAFCKALLATGDEVLTHSIGKKDISETVLTEQEFCTILMELRALMRED
jgi:predicted NAD-dependent protein-ADP-ribosyltransferase YbiA (DUF1768 family)